MSRAGWINALRSPDELDHLLKLGGAEPWSRRFHRLIHRQKRDDRMLRSFDRKEHSDFHMHESRQITEP
jgi:hypothetical protein